LSETDPSRQTDWARLAEGPGLQGSLSLIVRRLPDEKRAILAEVELSIEGGLAGDRWSLHKQPKPGAQVSIMSAPVARQIAGDEPTRLAEFGDNLLVELDLRKASLPPGTRLEIGAVELEVSDVPHTGCHKFARRFGPAAKELVNAPEHAALNLRGVYARVVRGGVIRSGDSVKRIEA